MTLGCVYSYKFMEISPSSLYNMNNYKIFKDKVFITIAPLLWQPGC